MNTYTTRAGDTRPIPPPDTAHCDACRRAEPAPSGAAVYVAEVLYSRDESQAEFLAVRATLDAALDACLLHESAASPPAAWDHPAPHLWTADGDYDAYRVTRRGLEAPLAAQFRVAGELRRLADSWADAGAAQYAERFLDLARELDAS